MRRAEALRLVGEYAADQWGMVTSAQAKTLGVDGVTLARLVDAGLLARVTHGVYGVPAAMTTNHQAERAAWLRLAADRPGWEREPLDPDGGVISHRSAAAVHDLGDLVADTVEITVPRRRTTRDPGVRLRTARLGADEVTRVDGLPVTTVERTIEDLLADRVDGGHVGDILAAAHRRHLVDLSALAARVAQFAPAYGVRGVPAGVHDAGPDRGARLIAHLLDHAGHDGDVVNDVVHTEHDRQVSTVARQLRALDPAQLHATAQLLQSMAEAQQTFQAAARANLTELVEAVDTFEHLQQQTRQQVGEAVSVSESVSESVRQATADAVNAVADAAVRLRPTLLTAEETRRQLAERMGLLVSGTVLGAPAPDQSREDSSPRDRSAESGAAGDGVDTDDGSGADDGNGASAVEDR